jgi:hypothetical protein
MFCMSERDDPEFTPMYLALIAFMAPIACEWFLEGEHELIASLKLSSPACTMIGMDPGLKHGQPIEPGGVHVQLVGPTPVQPAKGATSPDASA